MGIEFFLSTIPCTRFSSFTRSFLRTMMSMPSPYLPGLPTKDLRLQIYEKDAAENAFTRASHRPLACCAVHASAIPAVEPAGQSAELWMCEFPPPRILAAAGGKARRLIETPAQSC